MEIISRILVGPPALYLLRPAEHKGTVVARWDREDLTQFSAGDQVHASPIQGTSEWYINAPMFGDATQGSGGAGPGGAQPGDPDLGGGSSPGSWFRLDIGPGLDQGHLHP